MHFQRPGPMMVKYRPTAHGQPPELEFSLSEV
jgi:hypothetical protein